MPPRDPATLTSIQDIPWAEVVQNIRDESCVLVLGPHAMLNKEGKSITSVINDYLIEALDLEDERDFLTSMSFGPFHELMTRLFKDGRPASTLSEINKLIRQFELHEVYTESLIRIPIPLILYTAPDDLLETAFASYGIKVNAQKYPFRNVHAPFEPGFPMLYYLMGKTYRDNMSVLRHEDLFDYIMSVVSDKQPIPLPVSDFMKRSARLILLGFNYHSWYLNILFRLFDLHKRKDAYRRSYARPIVLPSRETMYFFRTNFNIDFIAVREGQDARDETPDIIGFIRTLHRKCDEAGLPLREVKKAAKHDVKALEKMQDQVKQLFQANTVQAMDVAITYFENRDMNLMNRLLIMKKEYADERERIAATGQDNGKVKAIQFDFLKLIGTYVVDV